MMSMLFVLMARKPAVMAMFVDKKGSSDVDVLYLVGKESTNDGDAKRGNDGDRLRLRLRILFPV
jgi:hypothetical protein